MIKFQACLVLTKPSPVDPAVNFVPKNTLQRPLNQRVVLTKRFRLRVGQGQRRLKIWFIFYLRISGYFRVIYFVYHCRNYQGTKTRSETEIENIAVVFRVLKARPSRIWSLYVVFFVLFCFHFFYCSYFLNKKNNQKQNEKNLSCALQKTTKNYKASAEPLFC